MTTHLVKVRDYSDMDRKELVDFAEETKKEYYHDALEKIRLAEEVVELAKSELAAATRQLMMQVKLADYDAYIRVSLDEDAMRSMTPGEKTRYIMSKGKYKIGMAEKLMK